MTVNSFGMKDRLDIQVYDGTGRRIAHRTTYNPDSIVHRIRKILGLDKCLANDLITNGGLADVADMIMDRYDYMSVGTGTTTPEVDDTELESQILTRSACSKSLTTTYYTDDTITFTGTFVPEYDVEISECGIHLLSGASGDVMFARETFTPVSCISGYNVQIAWQVILTR